MLASLPAKAGFILCQIRSRDLPRCCFEFWFPTVRSCISSNYWSELQKSPTVHTIGLQTPSQIAKWRLRGSVIFVLCAHVWTRSLLLWLKKKRVPTILTCTSLAPLTATCAAPCPCIAILVDQHLLALLSPLLLMLILRQVMSPTWGLWRFLLVVNLLNKGVRVNYWFQLGCHSSVYRQPRLKGNCRCTS